MKPLLFLDVDGVLNVYNHPDRVEVRTSYGLSYIPAGTRDRVHSLMDAFDIVWATAWRGTAHPHHRDVLGLPGQSWPYVDYRDKKLTEILKIARGRPWAFVDDDAEWELDGLHPAFATLDHTLILAPDWRIGLTDEHVEQLLRFAGAL